MNNEVIISCAVTGSGDTAGKHPNLPITPKQIAYASIEAAKAGAAVAHIHVREPDGQPSRNIEYYKEAAQLFPKDEKFVVFSNDIAWCKENFDFLENVEFSEGKEEWEDMISMSLCKNNIIANSSFSWWGAWLANKGTVIAPEKWFGPNNAHLDTSDLYPEHWNVI